MRRGETSRQRHRWSRTLQVGRIIAIALAITAVAANNPVQSQDPALTGAVPQPGPLAPDQLDQLLAPIALYPDPLLGQILMAATYPLEVVHAARWLRDPTHAALSGLPLATALDLQPWDPSIKALIPFPDIVRMMESSLEWTEAVGDAFLADEAGVMDAVQRLRQRAQSAGTLVTTGQQTVSTTEGPVVVSPVDPNTIYVPFYDPGLVYGTWVYAPYPPYALPPAVVYPVGSPVVGGLSFGGGVAVVAPLWGWYYWDWPHHRFHVHDDRYRHAGGHYLPPGGIWQHDPDHRRGVPYHDPGTRARFPGPPQGDVRGYGTHAVTVPGLRPKSSVAPSPRPAPQPSPPHGTAPPASGAPPGAPIPGGGAPKGAVGGAIAGPSPRPGAPAPPAPGGSTPKGMIGGALAGQTPRSGTPKSLGPIPGGPAHPVPPAFESFGRATDVRIQTDRGQSSRHTTAPQSTVPAPAPRAGTAPPRASHPGPVPPPRGSQPRR